MDDDGCLDYVPEEQYTEELWNEQKRVPSAIWAQDFTNNLQSL